MKTEKASATGNKNTHGIAGGLHKMFLASGIIFLLAGFEKSLKTLEILRWCCQFRRGRSEFCS